VYCALTLDCFFLLGCASATATSLWAGLRLFMWRSSRVETLLHRTGMSKLVQYVLCGDVIIVACAVRMAQLNAPADRAFGWCEARVYDEPERYTRAVHFNASLIVAFVAVAVHVLGVEVYPLLQLTYHAQFTSRTQSCSGVALDAEAICRLHGSYASLRKWLPVYLYCVLVLVSMMSLNAATHPEPVLFGAASVMAAVIAWHLSFLCTVWTLSRWWSETLWTYYVGVCSPTR